MRIYVGTLYTIENEIQYCIDSIKEQNYQNFQHSIFKGLPMDEAHDALYGDFISKGEEFDLLVKVDADMVIANRSLFSEIVSKFREDPSLERLSIAVHDWFSTRLILGMNVYSNIIRWQRSDDDLFTDSMKCDPQRTLYDWTDLAPAAVHCRNPSRFQAFHYGLHRGLKIIQAGRPSDQRLHWRMRTHWENMDYTYHHFLSSRDARLGYAIIGYELSLAGLFKPEHVSYSDPFAAKVFKDYEELDLTGIEREIARLRGRNWGWLPDRVRQAWLWYLFRDKHLSFYAIQSLLRDALLGRRTGSISEM